MNCYHHTSLPAIGICKTCFKALCPECAVDVGNGLACKGNCEEKVRELNELWERSAKIYGVGTHKSKIPSTGVLLWLVLSLGMWGVTAYAYFAQHYLDISSFITALIFTAGLAVATYSSRRTGLNC